MHTLNCLVALPFALLVLSACPTSEKVGGNPSEASDSDSSASETATSAGSSSGTTETEPTTTDTEPTTTDTEPATGSTTIVPDGPPSECGPPCDATWTHVGELVISGSSLSSTDDFKCMTRVVGGLQIYDLDPQQLSGLRNLVSVEGNLAILSETLTDLSPFSCLEEVTEQLQLGSAPNLTDVSGLSALRHTQRFLMLNTGATAVPTFSPEFSGLSSAQIESNDALVDLAAMANWKADEAGVGVLIQDNLALKSVAGLKPLLASGPMSGTSVDLSNLPALESLAGLEGLTEPFAISLQALPSIPDLAPLGQLKRADFLELSGMPLIKDLQGLSQLEQAGTLAIGSCIPDSFLVGMSGLTSLAGLSSLTTLDALSVYQNENLVTLDGADKLTSITQTWAEFDNPALDPNQVFDFIEQVGQDPCALDEPGCVCSSPPDPSETDGE